MNIPDELKGKLPLNYHLLQKVEGHKIQRISLVASAFHQTRSRVSKKFYKPISRVFK
ncbi:MAG TPA: hypothetical protein VEB86_00905 [Chryseosolibacter sp.]|nr:hypothetical protein [Chryseosolibacter sp.]